jgi:hypothetical protein
MSFALSVKDLVKGINLTIGPIVKFVVVIALLPKMKGMNHETSNKNHSIGFG